MRRTIRTIWRIPTSLVDEGEVAEEGEDKDVAEEDEADVVVEDVGEEEAAAELLNPCRVHQVSQS